MRVRFVIAVILLAIITALAFVSAEPALLVLAILFLLLILAGIVINFIAVRSVTARLEVSENSGEDGDLVVHMIFQNNSLIPVFKGHIVLTAENRTFKLKSHLTEHFSLKSRQETRVRLIVKSNYCGKYILQIKELRCFDVWGLTYKSLPLPDAYQACLFPKGRIIGRVTEALKLNYEKERKFAGYKNSNLSEILQYRDYQKGDNLRNVNWKLSVKHDKLIVREFDTPIDNRMLLIFDIEKGSVEYKNLAYCVLFSIALSFTRNSFAYQIAWMEDGNLIYGNIESIEELFRVMRSVLLADLNEDTSAAYLFETRENPMKYAKIYYIANDITSNVEQMIRMWGNAETISVEERYFSEKEIMTELKRLEL